MKLIFKGEFKGMESLPSANLPERAVQFDEPDGMNELLKRAAKLLVPTYLVAAIIMIGSSFFRGGLYLDVDSGFVLGIFLSLVTIFPHELLHAICFGRDAEVYLYTNWKQCSAFICCINPISKMRFIFMSMLPNVVFGWLPLLIWAFVQAGTPLHNGLLGYSLVVISMGVGDYLNVYNALRQMPKGSLQQLSGFHSYWYMP